MTPSGIHQQNSRALTIQVCPKNPGFPPNHNRIWPRDGIWTTNPRRNRDGSGFLALNSHKICISHMGVLYLPTFTTKKKTNVGKYTKQSIDWWWAYVAPNSPSLKRPFQTSEKLPFHPPFSRPWGFPVNSASASMTFWWELEMCSKLRDEDYFIKMKHVYIYIP